MTPYNFWAHGWWMVVWVAQVIPLWFLVMEEGEEPKQIVWIGNAVVCHPSYVPKIRQMLELREVRNG